MDRVMACFGGHSQLDSINYVTGRPYAGGWRYHSISETSLAIIRLASQFAGMGKESISVQLYRRCHSFSQPASALSLRFLGFDYGRFLSASSSWSQYLAVSV